MSYGDGNGSNFSPLVTIDICGHEMTHGVTERTSNLTYSGESGALNESMSDVFGAMVELYADGGVVSADTWKIGEDAYTPGTAGDALRYMNDPHLAPNSGFTANDDPDHYSERYTGAVRQRRCSYQFRYRQQGVLPCGRRRNPSPERRDRNRYGDHRCGAYLVQRQHQLYDLGHEFRRREDRYPECRDRDLRRRQHPGNHYHQRMVRGWRRFLRQRHPDTDPTVTPTPPPAASCSSMAASKAALPRGSNRAPALSMSIRATTRTAEPATSTTASTTAFRDSITRRSRSRPRPPVLLPSG